MNMRTLFSVTAWLGLTAVAAAHEGHGHQGQGSTILHYATEPMHLGILVFGAAMLISAILFARRWLKGRKEAWQSQIKNAPLN